MVEPLLDASVKQAIRDVVNGAVASMPSTVTVRHKAGHDRYGETYGPPETYTAMVQYKVQEIRDMAGAQTVAMGSAIFPFGNAPATMTPEDQLTLSDGSTPRIVAVQRDADPVNGVTPLTVYFA